MHQLVILIIALLALNLLAFAALYRAIVRSHTVAPAYSTHLEECQRCREMLNRVNQNIHTHALIQQGIAEEQLINCMDKLLNNEQAEKALQWK